MSDATAVLLAVLTAAGAVSARPVPLALGAVVAVAGLGCRKALVLCLGAGLLASALAARCVAGLVPPSVGQWSGSATLVSDPEDVQGGVRVEARVAGKRVEAWARGAAGAALRPRLAGERVSVAGRLRTLPPSSRARLSARHLTARLTIDEVRAWAPGGALSRLVNGLRRTLVRGAASLPGDRRALFTGFVLGDDRGQSPEVVDDFRASGLSHLLVVSGENVAFVLALASPLLRRLTLWWRVAAGVLLLGVFGTLTRWEPSVLRAEAMAVLALVAWATGRRQSGLRLLALAATGLILVDPLLVRSVGFLLSLGASAGIVLLAPGLTRVLPGPRSLAAALGVTAAAQLGVAPVLVPVFGGLPVASLPANLLAVPAAGPVMMWGMGAGPPAGVLGGRAAQTLHVPSSLLVGWVATVARVTGRLPLGELRLGHVVALGALAVLAAVAGRRAWRGARRAAAVVAIAVVLQPALAFGRGGLDGVEVTRGARVWRRGGATVLVADAPDPGATLAGLRRLAVRRLDLVVVRSRSRGASYAIAPVLRRHPAGLVLAPTGHQVRAAREARDGERLLVGSLVVEITATGSGLAVAVGSAGGAARV